MKIAIGGGRVVEFMRDPTTGVWEGTSSEFRFKLTKLHRDTHNLISCYASRWRCQVYSIDKPHKQIIHHQGHLMKWTVQESARLADRLQASPATTEEETSCPT